MGQNLNTLANKEMNLRNRVIIVAVLWACFVSIMIWVVTNMNAGTLPVIDVTVREFVLGLRTDWLNPIIIGITTLGNSKTIILWCALLVVFGRRRLEFGVPVTIACICSVTVQTTLKEVISRQRPPVENFLVEQGGFSFPSGHSCTALLFYAFLGYLLIHKTVDKSVYNMIGKAFMVLAPIIGLTRIYVGVHYPTDVLAGWSLGISFTIIAVTVLALAENKFKGKKIAKKNQIDKIDRNEVLLVDENDVIVGKTSKTNAHKSPMLHRAFSIFLYHEDKLLIQQRAFHKYHSGGLWANTCCSHPVENLWINEDAKARLLEETGISCDVEEIFSFVYKHQFKEDLYEHEYDHVFIGEYDGPFEPNPDEVEKMEWVSFEEVERRMTETPEIFAPWFLIAAPRVIEYLKAKTNK